MNIVSSAIHFVAAGGIWVVPILTFGAIGIGVVIERYWVLIRLTSSNKKIWEEIEPALHAGDFEKARQMTGDNKSYLGQLLSTGLENAGVLRRRNDIELVMEEVLLSLKPQIHKRINLLALFANLATLAGLFGTIVGLIHAFEAVATAAPSEKSALLTLSISEAMSCTALGLLVAMPMLVFSLLLNTKATHIAAGLEIAALKMVNMIARAGANARATVGAEQGFRAKADVKAEPEEMVS
ncbi:MAG TPA: MotA/TolQ/ExbB proton channel family protein [Luteolibacter sp.]|nr:MotA/TolQ/ExbB proton channel family protein [Luteolibacter sp.]